VENIQHLSDNVPSNLRFSNHYFWLRTDRSGKILEVNNKLKDSIFNFGKTIVDLAVDLLFHPLDLARYQFHLEKNINEPKRSFVVDLRTRVGDKYAETPIRWEFQLYYSTEGVLEIFGIGHPKSGIDGVQDMVLEEEENAFHLNNPYKVVGCWSVDFSNLDIFQVAYITDAVDLKVESDTFISWKTFVHPEDWNLVDACLYSISGNPSLNNTHCCFRVLTNKGDYIWLEGFWTLHQLFDSRSAICCLVDISENKRFQTLIDRQHKLLHSIIFEYSHTMRSKLTNIMGALALINPKTAQAENATYLKIIQKEAQKLDGLLKDSVANSSFLLK
jgi:hypothetical protein